MGSIPADSTSGSSGIRSRGPYREYEPRVRDLIALSGKWDLFPELKIPRMTAEAWIKNGYQGFDEKLTSFAEHHLDLTQKFGDLEKKSALQAIQIRLMRDSQEIFGNELNTKKIRSPEIKNRIISLVEKSILEKVPLTLCLSTLGLTRSRYKRWRREQKRCELNPTKGCIQLSLSQLTPKEIRTMRYYVTSSKLSHFPIKSLHFLAKKNGKLFCAYSTWLKYIHSMGWLRPKRKSRPKPKRKEGIRAKLPNEIWHLDVTQIILPDRTKIYVQAIIDNFSRYVLSWHVSRKYSGIKTTNLIVHALQSSYSVKNMKVPEIYVDGGTENNNSNVERLVKEKLIRKTVAQCDVMYSNSIVETLFRSLKNNHLYHVALRDFKSVKSNVDFYFSEHNCHMPHSSFSGETPKERFLAKWSEADRIKLVLHHQAARMLRTKNNEIVFCRTC